MTAAVIALAGVAALLAAGNIGLVVWLRSEVNEGKRIRDRLDEQTKVSAEYQHQRDVAVAELTVTKDQLATETNLRVIAETQRNEARQRARSYLARHLVNASENEITDVVQELFSTPLSVVGDSALMRTDE